MASIPTWFDYEIYMANKLAQLKGTDPDGNWTTGKLVDVFAQNGFMGEDGAYEHFVEFGAKEDVAPNDGFNASEYYAAKAAQFYGVEPSAVTELQIANVKAIIAENGMNAWTHYVQYGSDEGVNPSNAFDADAYLDAKTAALVAAGEKQPDGSEWTPEAVQKAISDAGMTVLEHYMTYGGTGEGEVAQGVTFPVPDDQKVPSSNPGETFTLTTGIDTFIGGDGDDIFNATESGGKPTLTTLDKLDGGAGEDTLNIVQDDAVDTTTSLQPTVTNMEKVNISSGAAVTTDTTTWGTKALNITAGASVDATVADTTDVTTAGTGTTHIRGGKAVSVTAGSGTTSITGDGLTTVSVKGGGAVTIDNTLNAVSSTGTTLTSVVLDGVDANSELKGQGLTDVTVKGATTDARTVNITNTTDHALNLNLDGVGYNAAGQEKRFTVKDSHATAMTVNGSGDKSSIDINNVSATSLNITGDAQLRVESNNTTSLTSIDGSTATGDLDLAWLNAATVDVRTGSGNDALTLTARVNVTVDTGAGDDKVFLSTPLAAGSHISLGAGDDSLEKSGSGAVATSAPDATTVIDGGDGFDIMNAALITVDNAAQFYNFEGLNITDLSNGYYFDAALLKNSTIDTLRLWGHNGDHNITLDNIAADVLRVAGANPGTTILNLKDAITGTADAFTVVFDGTSGANTANIVVNGIENLNVESLGKGWSELNVMDDALQNVTITGNKNMVLTFKEGTGSATHGITIDGSAHTADLAIYTKDLTEVTAAAGLTVKTGSGNDTIVLNQKATVDAGAGNDKIELNAGNCIITTGAGNDKVDVHLALTGAAHTMTTITDFTVGSDSLKFADHGTEEFVSEMTNVSSAKNLTEALNLAAANTDGANAHVTWFQYDGNTYIVEDMSADTTLAAGDIVVKLSGIHDLSGQILHDAISFA